MSHPKVAEAAVVGANDETTGQAVCAFVILRQEFVEEADEPGEGDDLVQELRNHVAKEIGADRQAALDHRSSASCPRPAPARSCAACCATSPRAARSAT